MADEQIVEPLRISKQLRKKEEQLPDSEKKSRSIFNTLIDIYYRTGMDGTILTVSPSGKKITAGILMTLSAPSRSGIACCSCKTMTGRRGTGACFDILEPKGRYRFISTNGSFRRAP